MNLDEIRQTLKDWTLASANAHSTRVLQAAVDEIDRLNPPHMCITVSDELVKVMEAGWSDPVRVMIKDGVMVVKRIDYCHCTDHHIYPTCPEHGG